MVDQDESWRENDHEHNQQVITSPTPRQERVVQISISIQSQKTMEQNMSNFMGLTNNVLKRHIGKFVLQFYGRPIFLSLID